jgi:hypothetical protein
MKAWREGYFQPSKSGITPLTTTSAEFSENKVGQHVHQPHANWTAEQPRHGGSARQGRDTAVTMILSVIEF